MKIKLTPMLAIAALFAIHNVAAQSNCDDSPLACDALDYSDRLQQHRAGTAGDRTQKILDIRARRLGAATVKAGTATSNSDSSSQPSDSVDDSSGNESGQTCYELENGSLFCTGDNVVSDNGTGTGTTTPDSSGGSSSSSTDCAAYFLYGVPCADSSDFEDQQSSDGGTSTGGSTNTDNTASEFEPEVCTASQISSGVTQEGSVGPVNQLTLAREGYFIEGCATLAFKFNVAAQNSANGAVETFETSATRIYSPYGFVAWLSSTPGGPVVDQGRCSTTALGRAGTVFRWTQGAASGGSTCELGTDDATYYLNYAFCELVNGTDCSVQSNNPRGGGYFNSFYMSLKTLSGYGVDG